MHRTRVVTSAVSAAFFGLLTALLLLTGTGSAASAVPLSPSTRAGLLRASANRSLMPWQQHMMRDLAGRTATPTAGTATTGADGFWGKLPPPMAEEAMGVYDPVRERMLYFGGRQWPEFTNDLWELTLSGTPTWTLLPTTGTRPSGRTGHVLLYDSIHDWLLLFGGADSMSYNDAWALDLAASPLSWGQGAPLGTPPSRRAYASAVFDSLNGRAIIFGGADSAASQGPPTGFRSDVWAISMTGPLAWTELTPAGTPPSPRAAASVIYDRARQRMVLFGGYDGGTLGDGFTLSLGGSPAWAPLAATGTPPSARVGSGVIYEAPQDRMILCGGTASDTSNAGLSDVWALNLVTPAWTQLAPTGGTPTGRQFPVAVYDTPRDRMVMFGGGQNNDRPQSDVLWSLSLGASIGWTDLGWHLPRGRTDHAAAYDPVRRVTWIHGGWTWRDSSTNEVLSDIWSLSLVTSTGWNQPTVAGSPLGARYGHSAIYDPVRDRLLFFGGKDVTSLRNDLWALTLSGTPTWSQLTPAGTPPAARYYHSAVYDQSNDRMIIFGGQTAVGGVSDVWSLSLSGGLAWTELSPAGTNPQPGWRSCAALDRAGNRLIVLGTGGTGWTDNQVFALSLSGSPQWTELLPPGPLPAARAGASMVSLGMRMLVFGGQSGPPDNSNLNDAWLLSLYPTPSWRQLDVGSLYPAGRMGHSAVFDETGYQLVVFGGGNGENDTWALKIDQLTPTLAALVRTSAAPDRVELTWQVPSPGVPATIYRRAADSPWTALENVDADGAGQLAFVDRDVVAGSRYGYRLGLPGESSEVFAGEVWVNVPNLATLTLRGMMPNPAPANAASVSFSLPDGSPARLDVVDVGGRRVLSQEVGGLGPGEHVIRLNARTPLPPGLYLVRLKQGANLRVVRAAVIN